MEQLGQYRLERHIATGGMADVWLATQEGPEGFRKEVVIKRIRGLRSGDDEFRTMFLDEARLTARLTHPNIVQIHELGEQDGEFFVAMEYVEGCDLDDVLRRDGKLDWAVAAHIIEQLLLALIYASELEWDGARLDIGHRDISPSNVLMSVAGNVKLADFGVAKALSNHHKTQTGATKGKLSYMSPEQVRADALDVRSDIFALGINLYEMVSGKLPFGDGVRALHAIQEEPHAPLVGVPHKLAAFVDKALAKDRSARFQTPEEMHDALIDVMRAESVHVSQRDVAELVEVGPVAATAVAIPSAEATTAEVAASTQILPENRDQLETAVVGASRPDRDERAPARLPWILIGVLFGVLIAGAASTVAFMTTESDEGEVRGVANDPDTTPASGAPSPADEKPGKAEKKSDKKAEKKAEKKPKKKTERPKKDDRDSAEEDREELERERRKREREIKKRLKRERKRLEREMKKWKQ